MGINLLKALPDLSEVAAHRLEGPDDVGCERAGSIRGATRAGALQHGGRALQDVAAQVAAALPPGVGHGVQARDAGDEAGARLLVGLAGGPQRLQALKLALLLHRPDEELPRLLLDLHELRHVLLLEFCPGSVEADQPRDHLADRGGLCLRLRAPLIQQGTEGGPSRLKAIRTAYGLGAEFEAVAIHPNLGASVNTCLKNVYAVMAGTAWEEQPVAGRERCPVGAGSSRKTEPLRSSFKATQKCCASVVASLAADFGVPTLDSP
mmetsp:Transcript_76349/g.236425  ORF Transcript_76349/g.236425 Transcript_76349/m.236425 type:complete len:264 (+) Transcript_76349:810-1601(+)